MQTKNNTTKRKRQTKTDEVVSPNFLIADENRVGKAFVAGDCESLGFLNGDRLLYDRFIEPVIGEPAIYTRKIKGKTEFGMHPFSSKNPRGWKYEGMITHFARCIYKSAYDILGAEFITSEVSE